MKMPLDPIGITSFECLKDGGYDSFDFLVLLHVY
jgi:hypothetical protein